MLHLYIFLQYYFFSFHDTFFFRSTLSYVREVQHSYLLSVLHMGLYPREKVHKIKIAYIHVCFIITIMEISYLITTARCRLGGGT